MTTTCTSTPTRSSTRRRSQSVARLWQHAYEQLYVPLAYTIFAAIARFAEVPAHLDSSLGHSISLSPTAFHVVSVALHLANAWLCFSLVRRLTGRTRVALLCSLLFALHPLQLESVGWISELRGLTSGAFALLALNAFVLSRQAGDATRTRKLLAASALLVICAMLCKPSAVVLPLAALAIDRVVLRPPWRKTLTVAALWAAVALPFALHHPRDPDRPRGGPVSLVAATVHRRRCPGLLPVEDPRAARSRRRLWTNAAAR